MDASTPRIAGFTELSPLCETVQHNCNIADARHAANYTMCVYLLKMREYFRWEQHYQFGDPLPSQTVGNWLIEREKLWEEIEEQPYRPLTIGTQTFDPFDTDLINEQLLPKGYVYSSGIGIKATPHFFIGRLLQKQTFDDYKILISNDECARDLTAPPAMTLGDTIFIRRESLQRMLWEKVNEWQWTRSQGLMKKALAYYAFDHHLEPSLQQICNVEIDTLIWHEVGETKASTRLGENWRQMLLELSLSRAEIVARAVKDIIADLVSTLPTLIKEQRLPSLYFYLASQTPMRKQLFPALLKAGVDENHNLKLDAIQQLIKPATEHWYGVASTMLKLFERNGAAAAEDIVQLTERQRL